jgi:hypothetical protein
MSMVKKQHYVPRFYLKYFTNTDSKVFVYDKHNDKVFETAVDNIACENYFYDSDKFESDILEEQFLEKFYSSIESEFAPFYFDFISKIGSQAEFEISKEDKNAFSNFLAFQIERTKEYREISSQLTFTLKDQLLERGVSEQQLTNWGFDINNIDPKDLHIESILLGGEMRQIFSEIFEQHIWILCENNTNLPFITSDNPIAKIANVQNEHRSYGGFASKGIEIIFPLNSKYLLAICEREFFKKLEVIENKRLIINDVDQIKYYNILEITESYRQVFSCENYFKNIAELKKIYPESFDINRKRVF